MFLWKIIEFYFNFHQNKSSTFIRRFQFSLKIIVSFLIAGLIAYESPLRHYLDQQYIICVISVLSTQETFGLTFYSAIQTVIYLIPLSIFFFLIQIIGLSYKQYLSAEILLLLFSFLIAYQCTQIQTRKIALLYNAIFFSTIVNEKSLPKLFVFLLLSLFLIGMLISISVSLIIFPFFATIDIENRFCYCLKNLQRMYFYLIQAFLSRNSVHSNIFLSRSMIFEQMIQQTSMNMQTKILETHYEPSKFLQKLFFSQRKHRMMNLNVQEQTNLINSLIIHLNSLQLIINQYQFNDYHENLIDKLQSSLFYLNSCQTSLISSFYSLKSISNEQFQYRLLNLSKSVENVRLSYKTFHLNHQTNSNEIDDHLSHGYFLFQLFSIVQLLTDCIKEKTFEMKSDQTTKLFVFQWSRFFLSIKSMMIIGVGSIFVMVPYLAQIFENGQWILIALCMTQSETVGGAFTTMKMRLIGTLLGAMWSYITYLLVHDNLFQTFLILIPWIFIFSYLRLFPKWNYTAAVASFTPILINLGRLPYGDAIPAGNYALLRIEENLVGILVAIILTLTIFPVYAIDLLKENIQKSLECCNESVQSMHDVYDELFHHEHLVENQMKSFLDKQRTKFQQIISLQRLFVVNASIEPIFFWLKNHFSSNRYEKLVQQQIDIFRILHNIDVALICLSEYSIKTPNQLNLPNIRKELFDLSQQIHSCLNLWINYFQLTQTRCFQLTNGFLPHRTQLNENDLYQHEIYLCQLNQTINRLTKEHQIGMNRLFEKFNQDNDLILLALSTMYFSFTQLANAALALGTTIHEIFELETTNLYQVF